MVAFSSQTELMVAFRSKNGMKATIRFTSGVSKRR